MRSSAVKSRRPASRKSKKPFFAKQGKDSFFSTEHNSSSPFFSPMSISANSAGGSSEIRRTPLNTKGIEAVRTHLKNDDETEAITAMGNLDKGEKDAVLASREFKGLAISAFGNDEMFRAMKAMKRNLYKSLEWMFDEGTDWESVNKIVKLIPSGKDVVRSDNWMKGQFVSICNDEEMATAVNLLGGTLKQKLLWMEAEGSNWSLMKKKLEKPTPEKEREEVYFSEKLRSFFVSECNDKEMTEAVKLMKVHLQHQLNWQMAEDVSAKYYFEVIRLAPDKQLKQVNANHRKTLKKNLNKKNFKMVTEMLDHGVLYSGNVKEKLVEKLYNKNKKGNYELQTFTEDVNYDIQYRRDQLRIIVRIKLTGESTTAALRSKWKTGITSAWNGKFHIDGPKKLKLVFDPQFTDKKPHYSVKVHKNKPRADSGNWGLNTKASTTAHEFGHLVGNEDEYHRTAADFQKLVGRAPNASELETSGGYTESTSIMGAKSGTVKSRHVVRFVKWLNSNRMPGEKPYVLKVGP
ncbi:MAG: hypothetical protein AAF502_09640 [Bacteroidota bacterium]